MNARRVVFGSCRCRTLHRATRRCSVATTAPIEDCTPLGVLGGEEENIGKADLEAATQS